jgi:hypothetical protein
MPVSLQVIFLDDDVCTVDVVTLTPLYKDLKFRVKLQFFRFTVTLGFF